MLPTPTPFAIRNIRLFIAFRIFFNARFYYPVFTILFLDYGLTIEQFALLNTVWAITIVCAEVPSGALADIIGRKKLLVATSLLMVCELSVIAFIPLDHPNLIFWAFFINRILSGLAEAMASGADEAMAYDSLVAHGINEDWPKVLSLQMRLKSIASIFTATLGALVYDPDVINRALQWLGTSISVAQQTTMRYPVYLTLFLSLVAVATSLAFQEKEHDQNSFAKENGIYSRIVAALRVTLQAGGWILRTPFAFAIIVCGMFFDHILRMAVTMTSQYFRLIHLPEASFGLISASLSLLGLLVPKIAEKMVIHNSAKENMFWLFFISIIGLAGLTGFFPYTGLFPMGLIFVAIMLVSFFTSHYLNRITDSKQRATVLSFKGLAFNLAYGLIGIFFALLIQQLRSRITSVYPNWSQTEIENSAFIAAVGWSPWYTLVLFLLALIFFRHRLQGTFEHTQKG